MVSELKELFTVWIAAAAAAVHAIAVRIVPQRRVLLTERHADHFIARVVSARPGEGAALSAAEFALIGGRPEPALPEAWLTALRGSRIEVMMLADRVLFRDVDFPKQAADFLDGMVRAQIDRLTPWIASEALFGFTAPTPTTDERIGVTLAATSRQRIEPLLKLAADCGAASVTGLVQPPEAGAVPIELLDATLVNGGGRIDAARLLRMTLLGAGLAAAASLLISVYLGSELADEQQSLQLQIAQRRAALRTNHSDSSAEMLLAKRKQSSPSAVLVLEAISRVLPDTTYVTELHVEGEKMQVMGLTHDAPSLIKLLEQSPEFSRATFFAPTTRGQNDSGERFHIEAHIAPYFGSGL